jgi:hypothetical protein
MISCGIVPGGRETWISPALTVTRCCALWLIPSLSSTRRLREQGIFRGVPWMCGARFVAARRIEFGGITNVH